MATASDNFNRANISPLDGGWTTYASPGSPFEIVSNVCTIGAFNADANAVWTTDTFGTDQFSEAAITVSGTGGGGAGIGVCVRSDGAASPTMYRLVADHAASNNIELDRFNAGTQHVLTTFTHAFTDGDVLRLEAAGSILTVKVNGTVVGTYDDSAAPINTGTMRPGIAYSSAETSASLDNWNGGDLTTGPAAQKVQPTADSVDGNWLNESGSNVNLYASIDEATAVDTDYITSESAPANSAVRLKVGKLFDPLSSTGHIIHWRPGKDSTGGHQIDMKVTLYQGGGNVLGAGTQIAQFTRTNVDALTTYDETLSAAQADAITNYGDLYLEFSANQV